LREYIDFYQYVNGISVVMQRLKAKSSAASSTLNYGWIVVATLSLTETVSYGILYYSFTVFVEPIQASLGWSKVEITGAFSMALFISGLMALVMGKWVDQYGARTLMTAGAMLAAVLMGLWASVSSLWAFYVIWIGFGVAMAAVLYEPAFALVVRWFTYGRSQALTTLTFIAGFASVIFIPLAGWLVEAVGWRSALMILGAILGVLTIPAHAFLLRDAPLQASSKPLETDMSTPNVDETSASHVEISVSAAQAFQRRDFWWLTASFTLSTFVIVGLAVHLVPLLINAGYAATLAAGMAGAIGTVALPGRIIFTPLGARISRHSITAILFVTQAVGLLILSLNQASGAVWLFVFFYGLGFGAISPARAALIAETYGTAAYGTISGRMTLFGAVARVASPIFISLLFGLFANYSVALYMLVGASFLAAYCVWEAGRCAPA